MYFLDTNILIYYFNRNFKVVEFLKSLNQIQFSISVVTRLEVMIGAQTSFEEIETRLDDYRNINLDSDIVREAVLLDQGNSKKMKFKDLIIAATAKHHGFTLITADTGFKKIKGLKTLIFKP